MKDLIAMGLRLERDRLWVLDQTLLPHEEKWMECDSPEEMYAMIRRLAVRGAPLIGVAAALALGRLSEQGANRGTLERAAAHLRESRPTAVNLMAAVDRMAAAGFRPNEAEAIFDEDVALCAAMAERGAALIQAGDQILTHCNSGALATAGVGTALGVLLRAHEQGKNVQVYVDETRPLLQGARLTAWELQRRGVPYTLICDNMAGFLMKQGRITRVFVGADRIARNGDFANKIGTYSLAVLARHHQVPMYVVAPRTTVDEKCLSGADIPVEERDPEEVRAGRSPAGCAAYNPSFDVTPRSLITGIVLDSGLM